MTGHLFFDRLQSCIEEDGRAWKKTILIASFVLCIVLIFIYALSCMLINNEKQQQQQQQSQPSYRTIGLRVIILLIMICLVSVISEGLRDENIQMQSFENGTLIKVSSDHPVSSYWKYQVFFERFICLYPWLAITNSDSCPESSMTFLRRQAMMNKPFFLKVPNHKFDFPKQYIILMHHLEKMEDLFMFPYTIQKNSDYTIAGSDTFVCGAGVIKNTPLFPIIQKTVKYVFNYEIIAHPASKTQNKYLKHKDKTWGLMQVLKKQQEGAFIIWPEGQGGEKRSAQYVKTYRPGAFILASALNLPIVQTICYSSSSNHSANHSYLEIFDIEYPQSSSSSSSIIWPPSFSGASEDEFCMYKNTYQEAFQKVALQFEQRCTQKYTCIKQQINRLNHL